MEINKRNPPNRDDLNVFINTVKFKLPNGFIDFYKESNGVEIAGAENYTILWDLLEMIQMNINYEVERYAPEFFIFGSDYGGNAFAIEKSTGNIFELPFIVMTAEDARFISNDFNDFLEIKLSPLSHGL